MPRGRPRKIVEEPPSGEEELVAKFMSERCSTPGCNAKFHMEDARDLLRRLRDSNKSNH